MAWERILKTQKVFVLREQRGGPLSVIDDIVGVFSSEEAMDKWLIKEYGKYSSMETDEEILEEIFQTYDFLVDKAEMKG
tara:strand:- start:162 stop:398 length:237 start_codon:yes stop_codon:yes gene_type:complete